MSRDQNNNGGGVYAGLMTQWTFWLANNGSPHLTCLADAGRSHSPAKCIQGIMVSS